MRRERRLLVAGSILMLGFVYLAFEFIAAMAWADPPYDWARNFISDLGFSDCAVVDGDRICSPLHPLMNAGLLIQGTIFTIGSILVVRGKLTATPKDLAKHPVSERVEPSSSHHGNWLACIKSRAKPVADVEIGHRSATVCHLGNLAVRLGRKVEWNPVTESVVNDEQASAMTDKVYRAGYEV